MSDILIKGMEMPKSCERCPLKCVVKSNPMIITNKGVSRLTKEKDCPLITVPEHGDLADKRVIIEEMGNAHDELWDKVDKKALSECHVAFLKAVMYAPTVIPSSVKIPTEGIEPKGVWDETWTTDSAVVLERTT